MILKANIGYIQSAKANHHTQFLTLNIHNFPCQSPPNRDAIFSG